jgi:chromosome partitioning protein
MVTIAICNHKGGVGKTTTAHNIGAFFPQMANFHTLLVDLDPQSNLTQAAGIAVEDAREHDIYSSLQTNKALNPITISNQLSIVPSTLDLSAAELELLGEPGREFMLKNLLKPLEFDICVIDCPPSLGLLTINALVAADYLLIPMQAEQFAVHGLAKVVEISNKVRERLNTGLGKPMILFTQFDKRKVLHRDIAGALRSNVKTATILDSTIRNNIALAEAAALGQSIFDYQPNSKGAEDYKQLNQEVIQMITRK